jgi:hypothetical protein
MIYIYRLSIQELGDQRQRNTTSEALQQFHCSCSMTRSNPPTHPDQSPARTHRRTLYRHRHVLASPSSYVPCVDDNVEKTFSSPVGPRRWIAVCPAACAKMFLANHCEQTLAANNIKRPHSKHATILSTSLAL